MSTTAVIFFLMVGAALFFLIRKVANLEDRITEEEGIQVAFFTRSEAIVASAIVDRLAANGIPAQVCAGREAGGGRWAHAGIGVYVEPQHEAAARQLLAHRERLLEEGD